MRVIFLLFQLANGTTCVTFRIDTKPIVNTRAMEHVAARQFFEWHAVVVHQLETNRTVVALRCRIVQQRHQHLVTFATVRLSHTTHTPTIQTLAAQHASTLFVATHECVRLVVVPHGQLDVVAAMRTAVVTATRVGVAVVV